MSQLRAMLPLPAAQSALRGSSESDYSGLEESPEAVGSYKRPSRRAFTRRRIPRVREILTRIAPRLTELDPLAEAGAMVYDCRPQVASLPTMITPVSDADRAWCAPEYMDAVIAPTAVLPIVIRAPAAATSTVSDVLSPIRSPAAVGFMSEIGTPPVTAVPDALLLCNTGIPSQTQPETDFSPQVCAACPDVGLLASKVSPDITNGSREGPFDTHHDRQGSPVSPRLLQDSGVPVPHDII